MSWEGDMFCAVCGGPFSDLEFAESSGTDESWDSDYVSEGSYEDDTSIDLADAPPNNQGQPEQANQNEANSLMTEENRETPSLPWPDFEGEATRNEFLEDLMMLGYNIDFDAIFTYNPGVIDQRDTDWTQSVYVLGYNHKAPGPSKAFFCPAKFIEYSVVKASPGPPGSQDPNFPGKRPRELYCYESYNKSEAVFPIHPVCFGLLGFHITGEHRCDSHTKLDKDALYLALDKISVNLDVPHALDIEYPFVKLVQRCQEANWACYRGYEFLVAHPLPSHAEDPAQNAPLLFLRRLISSRSDGFTRTFIDLDSATKLSSKVKSDPFRKLPYDMVYRITELIDDKSLFNLSTASWVIHATLRDNQQFWRHRIKRVSMPWLEEVETLLRDEDSMRGVDIKGLLCHLDKVTMPKEALKGGAMGIANRRRIWGACEVIGGMYNKVVAELKESDSETTMKKLREEGWAN